jgi:serine protease Do
MRATTSPLLSLALAALLAGAAPPPLAADDPLTLADVLLLEAQLTDAAKNAVAATVGVRMLRDGQPAGDGSGVIVTPDGTVLTAGHCIQTPGQPIRIVLRDGTELEAITLGKTGQSDMGMIRITTAGEYPYAPIGDSDALRPRHPVFAVGNPGGHLKGRPPVLRFGTVEAGKEGWIRSSCKVMPGDSGGGLFDLEGRVLGIHSHIGKDMTENFHAPVAKYLAGWQRLLASESWEPGGPGGGGPQVAPRTSWRMLDALGLACEVRDGAVFVKEVTEDMRGARADLRAGDRIDAVGGDELTGLRAFDRKIGRLIRDQQKHVAVAVTRGDTSLELRLELPPLARRR